MDDGWWSEQWFPFIDDGTENLICIDATDGQLVQYFQDDPDRDPVAPSATALFAAIVEALEANVLVCNSDQRYMGCVPASDQSMGGHSKQTRKQNSHRVRAVSR